MKIVALNEETFNSFLFKSHQIQKEEIQKSLEYYDIDIYSQIDRKRYKLIRNDERPFFLHTEYEI